MRLWGELRGVAVCHRLKVSATPFRTGGRFYFYGMDQREKFAEQRKRNQVAYAIEDFYDSLGDLRYTYFGNAALALAASFAFIFDGDNSFHIAVSLATAAGVYAVQQYAELSKWSMLIGATVAYVLVAVLEFTLGGLPALLIPFLTVEEGWVGFIPFMNSLFPALYLGIRLALVYPFINVCLRRRTLGAQPISTLRQLDRDLAMHLE